MAVSSSVERSAYLLEHEGEARTRAILSDRIARAFLYTGDAFELALDYNAHLVTELRRRRIWPPRAADRCEE